MKTSQATYVQFSTTDTVSVYNWRGKSRLQINETQGTMLEVSDIDTEELLRGVSYFVRNLAGDSERTETQTRILSDILNNLKDTIGKDTESCDRSN